MRNASTVDRSAARPRHASLRFPAEPPRPRTSAESGASRCEPRNRTRSRALRSLRGRALAAPGALRPRRPEPSPTARCSGRASATRRRVPGRVHQYGWSVPTMPEHRKRVGTTPNAAKTSTSRIFARNPSSMVTAIDLGGMSSHAPSRSASTTSSSSRIDGVATAPRVGARAPLGSGRGRPRSRRGHEGADAGRRPVRHSSGCRRRRRRSRYDEQSPPGHAHAWTPDRLRSSSCSHSGITASHE